MVFNVPMTQTRFTSRSRNTNTNVRFLFTFPGNFTVVRTCRNSLGSFAKMADAVKAEHGQWTDVTEVQGF